MNNRAVVSTCVLCLGGCASTPGSSRLASERVFEFHDCITATFVIDEDPHSLPVAHCTIFEIETTNHKAFWTRFDLVFADGERMPLEGLIPSDIDPAGAVISTEGPRYVLADWMRLEFDGDLLQRVSIPFITGRVQRSPVVLVDRRTDRAITLPIEARQLGDALGEPTCISSRVIDVNVPAPDETE